MSLDLNSSYLYLAADSIAKMTLLLVGVVALDRFAERLSAAFRHRVWAFTFVAIAVLPLATCLVPGIRLAVVPAGMFAPSAQTQTTSTLATVTQEPRLAHVPSQSMTEAATTVERVRHVAPSTAKALTGQTSAGVADPVTLGFLNGLFWVWLLGAIVAVCPLLAGVYRTMRLELTSRSIVEPRATRLFSELLTRFGLSRHVRLLESSKSVVPMTWNVLRPVVMVPMDWREWHIDRLRQVVMHELAHVARLDVFYQSIARVICSVFWFHPLCWYALRRLHHERELACDDCVIMAGELPSNYASQLVAIAREYQSKVYSPAVAMTQRSELENRVRALLDRARSHTPLTGRVSATVACFALVTVLAISPIRLQTVATALAAEESNSSDPQNTNSAIFRGQVVLPDGKPVKDASVHLASYQRGRTPEYAIRPVAKTDAEGRFEIRNISELNGKTPPGYMGLIAHKGGHGLAELPALVFEVTGFASNQQMDDYAKQLRKSHGPTLQLTEDAPFTGQILSTSGKPVANAKIQVTEVWSGDPNLDQWEQAATDSKADAYSLSRHVTYQTSGLLLPETVTTTTTDAKGRFKVQGIGREKVLSVTVSGPNIETMTIRARNRPGKVVKVPDQFGAQFARDEIYYPASMELVALPSTPIEGRVVDGSTGKPLGGFSVTAGRSLTFTRVGKPHIATTTDSNGRYRLDGLSGASNETLYVVPPEGSEYLPIGIPIAQFNSRDRVTQDFKLMKGVLLKGRVTDSRTGLPIRGPLQYSALSRNEHLKDYEGFEACETHECRADEHGDYAIAVLPGDGVIAFLPDEHSKYRRKESMPPAGEISGGRLPVGPNAYSAVPTSLDPAIFHVVEPIKIEPGARGSEFSFELASGVDIEATIKLSNGRNAEQPLIKGLSDQSGFQPLNAVSTTIEGYYADRGRVIFAYDLVTHEAARIVLKGPQEPSIVIQLKPSGVIRGRLIDDKGLPIEGARLQSDSIPQDTIFGITSLRHTTDDDGRFELRGVVPDYLHTVTALTSKGAQVIAADTKVDPEKPLDLGDIQFQATP